MQLKISPSILSADFASLKEEVIALEQASSDYIHIDVMDGYFVPNLTFGPKLITDIRKHTSIPFDVHLMMQAPQRYIAQYVAAGADILTIHYEASVHVDRIITQIKEHKIKAGISLVPSTPPTVLEYLLNKVDHILIMTVNPGFGGQEFIPEQLAKIEEVRKMIAKSGRDIDLAVDGGINAVTGKMCVEAGANILVAGQEIFKSSNYAANIAALRDV